MDVESRSQEDDIIAFDKDDNPVILVETKAMNNAARLGVPQLLNHLHESDVPFGMFADLEEIRIFRREFEREPTLISALRTADVLSRYEPEFLSKKIFPDYFETLVEAWLQDLAFHWKSEQPPALDEFTTLGLSERLAGGMTGRRRILGDLRLYGN